MREKIYLIATVMVMACAWVYANHVGLGIAHRQWFMRQRLFGETDPRSYSLYKSGPAMVAYLGVLVVLIQRIGRRIRQSPMKQWTFKDLVFANLIALVTLCIAVLAARWSRHAISLDAEWGRSGIATTCIVVATLYSSVLLFGTIADLAGKILTVSGSPRNPASADSQ